MNKTKISEIINLLKSESNEDNAHTEFFLENELHSESGKESIIRANKDGLLSFAQLLISNVTELESMNETNLIGLIDKFPKWLDKNSDIHF
jgi:hypothetical protein